MVAVYGTQFTLFSSGYQTCSPGPVRMLEAVALTAGRVLEMFQESKHTSRMPDSGEAGIVIYNTGSETVAEGYILCTALSASILTDGEVMCRSG